MRFIKIIIVLLSIPLFSHSEELSIVLKDARIFAPLKGTNATAGYATIMNTSNSAIKVTIEKADGFKAVELHESLEKDGRASMQKVDSITIEPKSSFELKPGGHHIMLFDSKKTFKDGELVSVDFGVNGKSTSQKFKIVPRASTGEDHSHH